MLVLPSHGTDSTGKWILVSVGGRSGWARRKRLDEPPLEQLPDANNNNPYAIPSPSQGVFMETTSFQATEGWMGNHVFF